LKKLKILLYYVSANIKLNKNGFRKLFCPVFCYRVSLESTILPAPQVECLSDEKKEETGCTKAVNSLANS